MRVSVGVVTYRRAWSLPYLFQSLAEQTRTPDEILVVHKPSGDGSEEVIDRWKSQLPIRYFQQKDGNVITAYNIAIQNAAGDLLLFIDDDAIAEPRWAEKYLRFFDTYSDAGGATGIVYIAELRDGDVVKTGEIFNPPIPTRNAPHRAPLPEYEGYCGWIATSGFLGRRDCGEGVIKSALLWGVNMAFRTELIRDCQLGQMYRKSRRGGRFEQFLAYCVRKKNYHTYELRAPDVAPVVWHISHTKSLTRERGFWPEFWLHYDRVAMYWRLKKLGARLSTWHFLVGAAILMRKNTLPRLLATLYGLVVRY